MLSVPPNGNLSTFERHYGVSVTYICHSGFAMRHGNENRTCQSSGQWSGTAPYCHRELCNWHACVVHTKYDLKGRFLLLPMYANCIVLSLHKLEEIIAKFTVTSLSPRHCARRGYSLHTSCYSLLM